MTDTVQADAIKLISIIHRSIDWSIWGSKRLKYWGTLENAIKSAAYTQNLGRFLTVICQKLSIEGIGPNKAARADLALIFDKGEDVALLRCLREQTALIVVSVRVEQEERKKAREGSRAEVGSEEEL